MASSGVEVREGFLCPICMADLHDVIQLQVHFEEAHDKEDPAFIQNLKDLFGKAKKKILNEDTHHHQVGPVTGGSTAPQQQQSSFSSSSDLIPNLAMEVKSSIFGDTSAVDHDPVSGVHTNLLLDVSQTTISGTVDHTAFFQGERKRRLDRNKITDQLLVRLERLLRGVPSDPLKRRSHEQSVVPWLPEDTVKLCPSCAKSFNIARRKHHCRLCGCVMCADCSDHVQFDVARKLVSPYGVTPDSDDAPSFPSPKKANDLTGNLEGLNTIMGLMDMKGEGATAFRTCKLCRDILAAQERKAEYEANSVASASSEQPLLVQFYSRLQQHIWEGSELSAKYIEMTDSLHRGEEEHSPEEAQHLRVRLLKIADNVDVMSKRIAALDTDLQLEATIQKRIRLATVDFIKETLVALPAAPSADEFGRLKAERVRAAERRVADEREAARLAKAKFEELKAQQEALRKMGLVDRITPSKEKRPTTTNASPATATKVGSGFVLTSSGADYEGVSDDPMVQQIRNLRGFITEAKRLGRYDEVAALEDNLGELQAEYKKGQEEERARRQELEDNYNSYKALFHKNSPSKSKENYTYSEEEAAQQSEVSPEAVDIDEYDASGKNPFF